MCARYTIDADPVRVADLFQLVELPGLEPRWNVAPSQLVPVVGAKPDGRRGLSFFKWGFVPHWEADPRAGYRPVNAKAETVATSPMWRDAFRRKRCLLVASGFYEWRTEGKKKLPIHHRLKDGEPFAFAGVWDVWKGEGRPPLVTCAIITVPANPLVKPFHDRMPAILAPDQYAGWLEHDAPPAALLAMLAPFPAELMEAVKLTPTANSVRNDGPECLTPAA